MRFDDDEYVRAFRATGEFPKIHDGIAQVIRTYAPEPEPFMDLGGCTGLLAHQALQIGRSMGIVADPDMDYLKAVPPHPRLTTMHMRVSRATLLPLAMGLQQFGVTLVIARRVFPEIEESNPPGMVRELARIFHQSGVKKLAVQGRVNTRLATNPLPSIEHEIRAVEEFYRPVHKQGQCSLLVRREG